MKSECTFKMIYVIEAYGDTFNYYKNGESKEILIDSLAKKLTTKNLPVSELYDIELSVSLDKIRIKTSEGFVIGEYADKEIMCDRKLKSIVEKSRYYKVSKNGTINKKLKQLKSQSNHLVKEMYKNHFETEKLKKELK